MRCPCSPSRAQVGRQARQIRRITAPQSGQGPHTQRPAAGRHAGAPRRAWPRSFRPESNQLKREILINSTPRETRVAILEDDTLVELLVDRPDARRTVGDIYLGRIEAVLPGIQAAFVEIGTEKSAFLHASDVVYPDDKAAAEDSE